MALKSNLKILVTKLFSSFQFYWSMNACLLLCVNILHLLSIKISEELYVPPSCLHVPMCNQRSTAPPRAHMPMCAPGHANTNVAICF